MRAALLAAALAAAAPATVERDIAVTVPGRVVVTLDPAVYEAARPDLGDLRVRDEAGTEVPYLLDRVAAGEARTSRPAILNRRFTRDRRAEATLDFGDPTLKTDLTLRTSGDDFRRRVVVEGRARRDRDWQTLTDAGYVFAVAAPAPARYETVLLPENNFPLLRVTVFHGPDDPGRIEILEASSRAAGRRRPREAPLAPRLTRTEDAERQETLLTLDLGARHQPFLALRLEAAEEAFFRGVVVEARVEPQAPSAEGAAPPLAWRYLGEGALHRYRVGEEARASLRLEVEGRARVLRVRILNRDDRPLTGLGATVLVPVERLAFEAAPGRRYRLRYGDPDQRPPSYDLARTAGEAALFAARAREAVLLAPRPVPGTPGATPPWTERHPALLWTGLLAVVAALGAVTWRALRAAA